MKAKPNSLPLLLLFTLLDCGIDKEIPLANPLQYPPTKIVYKTIPAPPGAVFTTKKTTVQIAVLEGNPRAEGLYTVRLKAPAGMFIGPHTHPSHERVTVLAGEIIVGFGLSADPGGMGKASASGAVTYPAGSIRYPVGSYYVNPKNKPHYLWAGPNGVTVQITGFGPWKVVPVAR